MRQEHVGKEGRVTRIFHLWLDGPCFEGVQVGFTDPSISVPTYFGLSHGTEPENITQPVSLHRVSFTNSLVFPS